MALNDYRDKDGELSRKHGNTLIGTLRSHYGADFATGCSEGDRRMFWTNWMRGR